ncbi:Rap/ran-GAP protein [Terramyces sp. JEL0728]|nr:Rap/ran-GAP protein [Terramyces sp. JEL0728]
MSDKTTLQKLAMNRDKNDRSEDMIASNIDSFVQGDEKESKNVNTVLSAMAGKSNFDYPSNDSLVALAEDKANYKVQIKDHQRKTSFLKHDKLPIPVIKATTIPTNRPLSGYGHAKLGSNQKIESTSNNNVSNNNSQSNLLDKSSNILDKPGNQVKSPTSAPSSPTKPATSPTIAKPSSPIPPDDKQKKKPQELKTLGILQSYIDTSHALTAQELEYWEESKTAGVGPGLSSPLPPTDDRKIADTVSYYHQVKLYSVKVLSCCEQLKNVRQDGRITLLQEFVSHFRLVRDCLRKFIDLMAGSTSILDLKRNGVDLLKYEILMTTEFLLGNGSSPNAIEFKRLTMIKQCPGFKEESCYDGPFFIADEVSYIDMPLEHLPDVHYYRRHFVNQDHSTFVGHLEKYGPVIISLKKEDPVDKTFENKDGSYRVIFRSKDHPERRELLPGTHIKKSFLGRKHSTKQVLQLLHKDINLSKLKQVERDHNIEGRILKLDELKFRDKYKFGVLLVKPGQTTDNEYFSNVSGSPAYDKFLTCLGDKVELLNFKGFSGGLDTTHGRTGKYSIYNVWKDYEIMYHCSTYLPYSEDDAQQIERKRHLGNVKHEIVNVNGQNVDGYRVAMTTSVDVPKFGPPLPNPPVFDSYIRLNQFLMAKLINGENSALKAPKFSKPNERAHHALFDDIVEEFLQPARVPSSKSDRKKVAKSMILSPTDKESPITAHKIFTQGLKQRQSFHGSAPEVATPVTAQSPYNMQNYPMPPIMQKPRSKDSLNSLTKQEQVMETMADSSPLDLRNSHSKSEPMLTKGK